MSDIVTYEVRGRVALITLNRPEARNAINGDVANGLEAAIDQMEDDDSVWVGILRANTEGQDRPVFSAGADLKAINAGQGDSLGTAGAGSPASSTATAASRSSSPSTGWRPPAAARSCSPPTSSWRRRARRSAWPR